MIMPIWDVKKTHWQTADAWRGAQAHEAITEAIKLGDQIIDLLNHATTLVERACVDVEEIIDNAHRRCQPILDRLTGETDRLEPILTRLRAAGSKAVNS